MSEHDLEITGNRKYDNSLIWKCQKCNKAGLGLIGLCAPPSGRTGRRKKTVSREERTTIQRTIKGKVENAP